MMTSTPIAQCGLVTVSRVEITDPQGRLGTDTVYDAWCEGCGDFLATAVREHEAREAAAEHVHHPHETWRTP